MKKIISITSLAMILFVLIIVSCKKTNNSFTTNEKNAALLKKKFGYKSVEEKKDISSNIVLMAGIKKKTTSFQSREFGDLQSKLNLQNATVYTFEDESETVSIPFISNDKENLVVNFIADAENNNYIVTKVCVVSNNVDIEGNGMLEFVFSDIIITNSYVNGEETSSEIKDELSDDMTKLEIDPREIKTQVAGKACSLCQRIKGEAFVDCMTRMYGRICDGFFGCVAWYVQPGVPILAAAVCSC